MMQLPPQAAAMEVDAPTGAASGAAAAPPPPVQAVAAGGGEAAATAAAATAAAGAAPASSADTAMTAAQDSHKAEEDGEAAKAESPKSAPRSRGRARVCLPTCLAMAGPSCTLDCTDQEGSVCSYVSLLARGRD